jgi:S1-C subfamily serine protease
VLGDFPRVRVRLQDGQLLEATRVAVDGVHDLALLKVDLRVQGLRLAGAGALEKGARVFTVGFPMPGLQGQESKVTEGIVNSLSAASRQDWFQFSAEIQPGNSGGPVVNEQGDVIGVVVAQANALKFLSGSGSLPQNVNFGIKASHVTELLRSVNLTPSSKAPARATAVKTVDAATVMVLADDPVAAQQVGPTSTATVKAREEALVEQAHPGWRSLVRTQQFSNWLLVQPEPVKRLASSPKSDDAILMLALFKRDFGLR